MLTTFQRIGKNARGRLELLTSIYAQILYAMVSPYPAFIFLSRNLLHIFKYTSDNMNPDQTTSKGAVWSRTILFAI